MSPNNHPHPTTDTVTELVTIRDRRRLDHLLDRRWQLAVTASAHHAHDLPDADELARQQYGLEAMIRDGWPDVYEKCWSTWVEQDAVMLHASDTLIDECAICTVLARHVGVNIEPPEAA
jgi:hypothetical protein